jgi:hypothetical protein
MISGSSKKLHDKESKAFGTTYQAVTDGFVFAFARSEVSQSVTLVGKCDNDATPSETAQRSQSVGNGTITASASVCFPVKKGEYWVVEKTVTGVENSSGLYWRALR